MRCRWQNGECRFGDRCNFAHGDDELRQIPPRVEGGGPGRGRGRGRGYDPSYNEDGENPPVGRGPGRGQVSFLNDREDSRFHKRMLSVPDPQLALHTGSPR